MKVIAISGVSGSGKTSIIKRLADQLDCPYLMFDDYVAQGSYPEDMKQWLVDGCDVSLIVTERFVSDIAQLKAQNRSDFMLIEEPFGRGRPPIGMLVDQVILLDMPMEICLARVMKRHITGCSKAHNKASTKYLTMYHDHFRQIYIETASKVRDDCDLIVKDVMSIEATSLAILQWLSSDSR